MSLERTLYAGISDPHRRWHTGGIHDPHGAGMLPCGVRSIELDDFQRYHNRSIVALYNGYEPLPPLSAFLAAPEEWRKMIYDLLQRRQHAYDYDTRHNHVDVQLYMDLLREIENIQNDLKQLGTDITDTNISDAERTTKLLDIKNKTQGVKQREASMASIKAVHGQAIIRFQVVHPTALSAMEKGELSEKDIAWAFVGPDVDAIVADQLQYEKTAYHEKEKQARVNRLLGKNDEVLLMS